jgi:hypothetical protein
MVGGLVAALGLLVSGAAAFAQEPPPLEVGRLFEGTLSNEGDVVAVPLPLAPGQSIQLDAIPGAGLPEGLDLVLTLYAPDGTNLAVDDDSGGSGSPRLVVQSEAGGLHRIEVSATDGTGPFTLMARESRYRPPQVTALDLADGRAETDIDFADPDEALYRFDGRSGDIYIVSLTALDAEDEESAADPYLEVFEGEPTTGTLLTYADDTAGSLNSRALADLLYDGLYTIRATSLSSTGKGRLVVERLVARPAPLTNLSLDGEAKVTFGAESPVILDTSSLRLAPYALFRLDALLRPDELIAAGDTLIVRATTQTLAPVLEVGFAAPTGFLPLFRSENSTDTDGANVAVLRLDPAPYASSKGGGDGGDWWDRLRVRLAVPVGSEGEVTVSAARVQRLTTIFQRLLQRARERIARETDSPIP